MNLIKNLFITVLTVCLAFTVNAQLPLASGAPNQRLLNDALDISADFYNFANLYFVADSLTAFDPETGRGQVKWMRHQFRTNHAFNNTLARLTQVEGNEFPGEEYATHPTLSFGLEFISPKTVRIRMKSGFEVTDNKQSLMLLNGVAPNDDSWVYSKVKGGHKYTSPYGAVIVREFPWHVEFYDADGKLLTKTNHPSDNSSTYTPVTPFSFVRRAADYSRSMNAVFSLAPGEKIFGTGENFKGFDKRGQKVVLWIDDPNGVQNETMYKPIPFFMSSRGYGMFMHTSSPITCDFGKYFNGVMSLMIGDEELDLFVFLGKPKTILDEYTSLTGKAAMPPLWSFGLWMSRITYFSEADGRKVARLLRENRIPSDVIHFDTGWFEVDWRSDYKFAPSRFPHPLDMINDLNAMGFKVSLWQLPYFVPKNSLFPEIIEKGLFVKNAKGNLPYDDAVLDFSNPDAIKWYQAKLRGLLEMGVGAIKVDFGEAAPADGLYASGRTGFYEHNLYPLRYNKVVADITKEVTGENIIWARSTWAGSQRYPLHWGGDAANSNTAMAATLRGGLSLGLSGFTFWSHDIGGFVQRTPEDLYRRWLPFGMLSSHARTHGAPPKEPWEYNESFNDAFRRAAEMRYRLMPYIYAQAKHSADNGLPMVRALLVEYPEDAGAWLVDDAYLFGTDMLVAPLFESTNSRDVYLPGGKWIDYQTGKIYDKGWHHIEAGEIPAVILVRDGAAIPQIKLAQSTQAMDWSELEIRVFAADSKTVNGYVCLPDNQELEKITLKKSGKSFMLTHNPLEPQGVKFKVQ